MRTVLFITIAINGLVFVILLLLLNMLIFPRCALKQLKWFYAFKRHLIKYVFGVHIASLTGFVYCISISKSLQFRGDVTRCVFLAHFYRLISAAYLQSILHGK